MRFLSVPYPSTCMFHSKRSLRLLNKKRNRVIVQDPQDIPSNRSITSISPQKHSFMTTTCFFQFLSSFIITETTPWTFPEKKKQNSITTSKPRFSSVFSDRSGVAVSKWRGWCDCWSFGLRRRLGMAGWMGTGWLPALKPLIIDHQDFHENGHNIIISIIWGYSINTYSISKATWQVLIWFVITLDWGFHGIPNLKHSWPLSLDASGDKWSHYHVASNMIELKEPESDSRSVTH